MFPFSRMEFRLCASASGGRPIVFSIESWSGELSAAGDGGERASWELVGADDDARMDFVRSALRDHLDR